jgi:type IV pilus assembly protein PilE
MKFAGRPVRSCLRHRSHRGFSLLELMIALLILSIILGFAVPSFHRYMQRAQRAEAIRMLLAVAACQERIRAQTGHYDTTRCLDAFESAHYTVSVDPPENSAANLFTLIADPLSAGPDDVCGALSLDQSGTRSIEGDASVTAVCWAGR